MRQSLLAFLAMAIFTLLALTQQRATMHYHGLVYGREYEIAAMNMITEQLTKIQSEAFDEVDTESTADPSQRTSTDDLTATLGLETDDPEIDDIDDYDGYRDSSFVYMFNGYPYAFDVSIDVCYIDVLNPSGVSDKDRCVSTPTLAKQVTITIKDPETARSASKMGGSGTVEDDEGSAEQRYPVFVQISRVYSPAGLANH